MKNIHSQVWQGCINYVIIITSDSKTLQSDLTGALIKRILNSAFKNNKNVKTNCYSHTILKNNQILIRNEVKKFLNCKDVNLIITSGGTGISKNDVTIEAVKPLIEKELSGFGELFRILSFKEVRTRAFLSRCLCGIAKNKVVFCLPGSPNASSIALKKLIIPEIRHIFNMLN